MQSLAILLPFAWRNLWRNRRRTLITLAVVSVGVWSILAFNAVLRAWSDSALAGSLKNLTAEAQLHAPGYRDNPEVAASFAEPGNALAAALASTEIAAWAPRVRVPAIVQSEYRTLPVTLVGIVPQREAGVSFIAEAVERGKPLGGPDDDGVVIGRHLAERLKSGIGKRVVILSNGADGRLAERGVRVKGIFSAAPGIEDRFLFSGLGAVQRLLRADGRLSEIAVMTSGEVPLDEVLQLLRGAAPDLDVAGWPELEPMTKGIHDLTEGFIYIWLWVMFILISIGVVNTQLMAVFERTREFGLLRALGLRRGWIVLEVLLEGALIIGLGVVAGAAAAWLTVYALQGGISLEGLSAGADFLGIERVMYPRIDVTEFSATIAVVWGLGVLAALWPARRAAHVSAVQAMHSG